MLLKDKLSIGTILLIGIIAITFLAEDFISAANNQQLSISTPTHFETYNLENNGTLKLLNNGAMICNDTTNSSLYQSNNTVYWCDGTSWSTLRGADGTNGVNGSDGANGTSDGTGGWTNTSTNTTTLLNVGIGTTNPTSKLHVNGDVNISSNIVTQESNNLPTHRIIANGNISTNIGLTLSKSYNDLTGANSVRAGLQYDTGTSALKIFQNYASGYTSFLGASSVEFMRLNGTGALGIGTTSPTATLDVRALNTGTPNIVAQATAGQTAPLFAAQDSSGNNIHRMYLDGKYLLKYTTTTATAPTITISKNGNASGTPNPVASGAILGRLEFDGGNGSIDLPGAYIQAVTTQAFNSTGAGTDLKFYTTSTNSLSNLESMSIVGTGTVDIKRVGLTITPTSVPVLGGSNTFQIVIRNSSTSGGDILSLGADNTKAEIQSFSGKPLYLNRQGNSVFFSGVNTNIGIGKSSATQRLDVNGSINISATDGKLYLPSIPGTGNYICINTTDLSLFRNTTCP